MRTVPRGMGLVLFLAFSAAALPCLLATGLLLEAQARRALEAEMSLRVEALASTVRAAISPAAWEALLRLEPGEDDSRTARSVRDRLEGIRREISADWLGVWSPEGRVLVETSGRYRLGEHSSRATMLEQELSRVRAGQVTSSPLFQSESGRWVKIGLAGIQADRQESAAVILVSAESGSLEAVLGMRRTMILVAALGWGLVLFVAAILAGRLTRRLGRLATSAISIGRGELETAIPDLGEDEIGLLARTLDQMRLAVAARERQLRAMLGGVAHEIRNPLGGLILSSEMLARDETLESKQRRQAERILAEGERLERVVETFLEYARPHQSTPSQVDLAPAVADCLENASLGLEWRGELSTQGDRLMVWCDADHLRQILLNLGRNAMQASGPSGRVAVSWKLEAARVRFAIGDSGPGIELPRRKEVFEPFQTSKASGAGLGLAVVKQLCDLNGISVAIEGSPVGGAAFILHLPVTRPRAGGKGD